jgi:hypothetical protein
MNERSVIYMINDNSSGNDNTFTSVKVKPNDDSKMSNTYVINMDS